MTRSLLFAASVAALACAVAGCPSTATNPPYTPITGIEVLASDITAGRGCGTGDGQVYKYAVVVSNADGYRAAGVFDCFADAIFSNLPVEMDGGYGYDLAVYAFNAATFPSGLAQCTPQQMQPPDSCPAENPGTVTGLGAMANWTTTCTATQPIGATQVASCCPVVPRGVPACSDAGVSVEEAGADATEDAPADASVDAAIDAPGDAPGDAPAPMDASTDAPVDAPADALVDAPADAPADAPDGD